MLLVLALTVALEAITAVDRTVSTGLEGHLSGSAAAIADYFVHLTVRTAGVLAVAAGRTATGATAGLVLESLVRKELLFRSGKYEFGAAVTAGKGLVFKHG